MPSILSFIGQIAQTVTNSFSTIQPDLGTSPVATSPTDTLTLTSSDSSVTITGNSATDTINLQVSGTATGLNAQFLTLAASAGLANERIFTPGTSLTATDGGAGGTYSLNTIQDIRTSASPTFTGLTLSGLGLGIVHSSSGGLFSSSLIINADVSASAAIAVTKLANGTANQIISTNTGATANEFRTLSGTSNQISVAFGSGTITLSTPQDIATGSSPTFTGLTLSGLGLGIVHSSSGGLLSSSLIVNADVSAAAAIAVTKLAIGTANQIISTNTGATANEFRTLSGTSNQVTVTFGSGTITLATPQNIGTGSSPTFAGLTLSGLGLGVVHSSAGGVLSSSNVNLITEVTGTLPVGNGGTSTSVVFTTGSVVFSQGSGIYSQNNSNFFWDNPNKRLGLGTSSPGSTLEIMIPGATEVGQIIQAAASQSGDLFQMQDSSANNLFVFGSKGDVTYQASNRTISSGTSFFDSSSTLTLNNTNSNVNFFRTSNTINYTATPTFGIGFAMFSNTATIQAITNNIQASPYIFFNSATYNSNGVVWTGGDIGGSFVEGPVFSISNSGSFAAWTHTGFRSYMSITGGTVQTRQVIKIQDASGAGSLTNQIGIDIDSLTKGGTSNIAIRTGASGVIQIGNLITKYNNTTTTNSGVPYLVATSDLTAQGAAIAATTIYAVPASGAGLYRVSWVATVTRAATTSCVLGGANGFQLKFTDNNDSVVKTSNPTTVTAYTSATNATGTSVSGTFNAYCKASTNLQYLFDYTSVGITTMQYDLSIRVEAIL